MGKETLGRNHLPGVEAVRSDGPFTWHGAQPSRSLHCCIRAVSGIWFTVRPVLVDALAPSPRTGAALAPCHSAPRDPCSEHAASVTLGAWGA